MNAEVTIRETTPEDAPLILDFIRGIAEYEKLAHEVVATEESLRDSLFGPDRCAECLLAFLGDEPVAYAIFFHNFSTFIGRRGLYLEDLFVKPERRGLGIGKRLLVHLAGIARDRKCGRFEWVALDWNESAINFYKNLGAEMKQEWELFRLDEAGIARVAEMG
jgi:GNAT superfamily N-acetyltransferase